MKLRDPALQLQDLVFQRLQVSLPVRDLRQLRLRAEQLLAQPVALYEHGAICIERALLAGEGGRARSERRRDRLEVAVRGVAVAVAGFAFRLGDRRDDSCAWDIPAVELVFATVAGQSPRCLDLLPLLEADLDAAGAITSSCEWSENRGGEATEVIVDPGAFATRLAERPPAFGRLSGSLCLLTDPVALLHPPALALAGACAAVLTPHAGVPGRMRDRAGRPRELPLPLAEQLFVAPTQPRDIDVLVVAPAVPRVTALLAGLSDTLEPWEACLLLGDVDERSPVDASPTPAELLDLLAHSRIVLCLHPDEQLHGLQAGMVLQAMHAGCAVISEPGVGLGTIEPGRDIVVARPSSLGAALGALAGDEDRRRTLAAQAQSTLAEHGRRGAAAEALLTAAREAPGSYRPTRGSAAPVTAPPPASDVNGATQRLRAAADRAAAERKARALAERAAQRDRRRRELEAAAGGPIPELVADRTSPAWRAWPEPSVSVLTALFEHGRFVEEALDSVDRSTGPDVELVVVDDGSDDGSGDVVARWMDAHPERPAILLRHPVNRGLPAARNSALSHARAPLAFVLDADNEVRPNGIRRLRAALEADPGAAFGYGMLERFGEDVPPGLVSTFGWEPERLRIGNQIDAMALFRVPMLREIGGYDRDPVFLGGWEDYELWLRLADRGLRGAFVPQITGRYRVAEGSLLSLANLSLDDLLGALQERYPWLTRNVS